MALGEPEWTHHFQKEQIVVIVYVFVIVSDTS